MPGADDCFLSRILDALDVAVIGSTADGRIVTWNAAAERLYGYRADEIVGHSIARVLPGDAWDSLGAATLASGEVSLVLNSLGREQNGKPLTVPLKVTAIRAPDGTVAGLVFMACEGVQHERASTEVAASDRRLKKLVESNIIE